MLEYKKTTAEISERDMNALGKEGWILVIYKDLIEEFIWAREIENETNEK